MYQRHLAFDKSLQSILLWSSPIHNSLNRRKGKHRSPCPLLYCQNPCKWALLRQIKLEIGLSFSSRGGNVLTATAPEGCFFYGVAMSSLPQHLKGASFTGWQCPHCHSTRRVLFLFIKKATKRSWASPKCQPKKQNPRLVHNSHKIRNAREFSTYSPTISYRVNGSSFVRPSSEAATKKQIPRFAQY
jgi:hypothetical protein